MCQIIVSEKNNPAHIKGWLDNKQHRDKHVIVIGDANDPVVQKCLAMATARKIPIGSLHAQ